MKKIWIGIIATLFLLAAFILRPVPMVSEDQALMEKGIVTHIFEAGEMDVVFRLQHNDRTYYINRGLEAGLVLEDLQRKLLGQEVVIKYPKYWSPLDWNNQTRHISKVAFREEVIFNEFKTE